tara:strand:- start:383 stop:664 length:282 start_codon:yes stop_codon:yes gene_type:complete
MILTNRKAFMYKEEMMIFEFDIVKNSRNDIAPYYHTQEVVGRDSVELNVFGYNNPYEVYWKWAAKAQREYTKANATDARDSFIFREWSVGEEE